MDFNASGRLRVSRGFRGMCGSCRLSAFFAAVLCALSVSCAGASGLRKADITLETAGGARVTLKAELARTKAEQERGYMGRTSIPDGTSMLFVFSGDQVMTFWMKNTPHPLSIAYISSDGIIRDILDMQPFSLDITASSRSVRYALEVPQGWFARAGIAPGDRLSTETIALLEASVSAK